MNYKIDTVVKLFQFMSARAGVKHNDFAISSMIKFKSVPGHRFLI